MKKYALILLSVALVASGAFLAKKELSSSNRLSMFNSMLDGVQTCFLRVNQSYSARMIGLESSYLKKTFLDNTEKCFEELNNIAKKNKKFTEVLDLSQDLSDQVYWFHRQQNFENPFTSGEELSDSPEYKEVVTSKFKRIENLNETISSKIKQEREQLLQGRSKDFFLKVSFIFIALLLITLLIRLLAVSRKRKESDDQKETSFKKQEDSTSFPQTSVNFGENDDSIEVEESINLAKENEDELYSGASEIKPINQRKIKEEFFDYGDELKAIIKNLSPLFFNLNSSLNFNGLEKLKYKSRVEFNKKDVQDFLQLISRFASGGKYPIQVDVNRQKNEDTFQLKINAVNTNYCLYLDKDIKNSIVEIKEIVTHDHIVLGFELCKTFKDNMKSSKKLNSIFVGQKKQLIEKIRGQSVDG